MPTVTSRPPAPAKPSRTHRLAFDEGEALVYSHRPSREKTAKAIARIRKIMKDTPEGDVVESLKAFRDNPRG